MVEAWQAARSVSLGAVPDSAWLSGFYMNSALLRLALLSERIGKHGGERRDIPRLRRLANRIKHEPSAQMGGAWNYTLVDAVEALEELLTRLVAAILRSRS